MTSGKCLCGSTTLSVASRAKHVGACHCGMCRRWGGGPLLAVDCGTEVMIDGEDNVGVFDSSQWAERGFCRRCGTHLFYRLKHNKQYHVPAGLLDGGDDLVMNSQVFIDEKPDYYNFAEETENLTGAQIFEKYAPK